MYVLLRCLSSHVITDSHGDVEVKLVNLPTLSHTRDRARTRVTILQLYSLASGFGRLMLAWEQYRWESFLRRFVLINA